MSSRVRIGLIAEGKIPEDNRVAFTPQQCRWILDHYPRADIKVQPASNRCFTDEEYRQQGITVAGDLEDRDILMGIKEVPPARLLRGKTYLMFSHTKKMQPYNRELLRALINYENTLIDYECLTHEDGQRILGFGFFAGVVGAHNGLLAYGNRTGAFSLRPVTACRDFKELAETYFGIKLPPLKIVVTGSGRVAAGILEVMGMLGIKDVPAEEFLISEYKYPVYTQLKAGELYLRKSDKVYNRDDFHRHSDQYECKFLPFITAADILMNGIYWEGHMAPLFSWHDLKNNHFRIQVIADISNDAFGSVPCNLGESTAADPVYGVNRFTGERTAPCLTDSVDMMCVGNLPNELPRDASRYFGDQLLKYVLEELLGLPVTDPVLKRATMVWQGGLTPAFRYLQPFVDGENTGGDVLLQSPGK